MIEVKYDGEYPTTCMGTLEIIKDGKTIYKKQYCCESTGYVWFDKDWMEHIEEGELIWKDSEKFDKDIQEAVREKLYQYSVCCGGCV